MIAMTERKSNEIICPACGKESILTRIPRYEGFKRIGEDLACALCKHVFAGESDVTFKPKQHLKIFGPEDFDSRPKVFNPGDAARLCRHCEHYVVNPFIQRCALRGKEVEATDSCAGFKPRAKKQEPPQPANPAP